MTKLFTALFAASLLMQPVPVPDYTPSEADVTALSRMAYGEARGLADYEIAACMWCVMNRIDAGYGDTVQDVVSAPGQFAGYSENNPVDDHIAEIARDVLTRHHAEQQGETVPREIGSEYVYFSGNGVHNYFRAEYDGAGVLPEEVS